MGSSTKSKNGHCALEVLYKEQHVMSVDLFTGSAVMIKKTVKFHWFQSLTADVTKFTGGKRFHHPSLCAGELST